MRTHVRNEARVFPFTPLTVDDNHPLKHAIGLDEREDSTMYLQVFRCLRTSAVARPLLPHVNLLNRNFITFSLRLWNGTANGRPALLD